MCPGIGLQNGSDEHAASLMNGSSLGASSTAPARDVGADMDAEPLLRPHVVISADTDGGSESLPADWFSWRKLWAFTGPGFLMSIAYIVRLRGGFRHNCAATPCFFSRNVTRSPDLCAGPGQFGERLAGGSKCKLQPALDVHVEHIHGATPA